MRAQRFDSTFIEIGRMPLLVRAFRDLGIEIETQSGLHMDATPVPGVQVVAVDVPNEAHVLQRLGGGYQDVLRSLRGLATAEHLVQTDATLPVWQRWLGDPTPTLASGLLMEGLGRDKVWLANRLDFVNSTDYLVISHLAWLYRVRQAAAGVLYEQRMWQVEPGGSLAADFEVDYGSALRTRYFGDDYMLPLIGAPWSTLDSAMRLRAEVFAAHVRAYLEREFDEEWWRSPRAARVRQPGAVAAGPPPHGRGAAWLHGICRRLRHVGAVATGASRCWRRYEQPDAPGRQRSRADG